MVSSNRELLEAVLDEQRVNWQRGDRVLVEALLERHPALQGDPEAVLGLIENEIDARTRQGEPPPLDEYLRRFPPFDSELRCLFAGHETGSHPMGNITPFSQVEEAIENGDTKLARDLLTRYPDLLQQEDYGTCLLRFAARKNSVPMMALLVEFGAEISAPHEGKPEGAILDAASEGAADAVKWLLDRGAQVNYRVDGQTRCWSLTGAVVGGHLDVVKLLVERGGADINAVWIDVNALSYAIMYGRKEVEAYLRSKGAREPWQLAKRQPAHPGNPFLAHLRKHLGQPKQLSLHEVTPGDPPIAIYAVPGTDQLTLVTSGMSDRPMTVPPGGEEYQFAELVVYLPPDWPVTDKALQDPNYSWPIDWLRQIARYPHDQHTWLGGPSAVIANEEPPRPLAPNTQLTCLLASTEVSDFGSVVLSDGRQVVFYSLYPLYTEERDLEKQKGTAYLVRLFQKRAISHVVDIHRPNVARASGRRPCSGRH